MLQRISNSCTFSFDCKASLKKNKNLDKRENHSQILQSSTWSQKSQLYLCEMQLPETHMKPVVLDKCISFQFSHWSLCDWEIFLSIWTKTQPGLQIFTFCWRNTQMRTGHRFRQWRLYSYSSSVWCGSDWARLTFAGKLATEVVTVKPLMSTLYRQLSNFILFI